VEGGEGVIEKASNGAFRERKNDVIKNDDNNARLVF
jgi:hypothetical protein